MPFQVNWAALEAASGSRTNLRAGSYGRRLGALLADHKALVAMIFSASILINVCGLAAPRFTQEILDRVIPSGDASILAGLVLILALIVVAQIGLGVWRRIALIRLSFDIDRVMLGEFCNHLLSLPTHFFKEHQVGDLVARFQDQGYVRHLFSGGLMRGVIDSVMVLVYLGVMAAYSPSLTLIALVPLGLFAASALVMGPLLKRGHRRLHQAQGAYEAQLVEALMGIDVVKGMGFEGMVQSEWHKLFDEYLSRNERVQRLKQVLESGRVAIQFVSTVAVFWFGAMLVVGGELTTGQLVAFSLYAGQALPPLLSMIALWDDWQQAKAALDRMQEVIDQEPELQPPAEVRVYPVALRGEVRLEQVHFTYGSPGAPEVLKGVDFRLQPGERVALVGRSGCGKTTVARLILGLCRPTAGRVVVDGRDLREFDLATYRRRTAVVLQENLLFAGALFDNIAMDDPAPDRQRVEKAARLAGAHEFIAVLPRGYETLVGELGMTLSAGERQRVSLARALYREPRILILDEATSALDSVNETVVQRNLEQISAERTTLVIAHKIATVRNAHRILVLEHGLIVEQGTHDELLAHGRAYFSLASEQLRP